MQMENSNPVFYSTIQHPSDYEMQMMTQAPLQKKLSRGSSYAERRNQNKLNYTNYNEHRRQEDQRLRYQVNSKEIEHDHFNTQPVRRPNEQGLEYDKQDLYSQEDISGEINENKVEELKIGQNVFYDNASKSNSPTKKVIPKLLNQNSKQLSFSNMTSENNMSKKKKVINDNKPKSMMRLATEEDQYMVKGSSRMGKNMTKGKLGQIVNPDTGKPMRKRNSKAGKKKTGGDMYKGVPTKRRGKKGGYQQEESITNKSYKNNKSKYMNTGKKKLITMGDRKMFGKGSPKKNEEDRPVNNYSSKVPRTSKN